MKPKRCSNAARGPSRSRTQRRNAREKGRGCRRWDSLGDVANFGDMGLQPKTDGLQPPHKEEPPSLGKRVENDVLQKDTSKRIQGCVPSGKASIQPGVWKGILRADRLFMFGGEIPTAPDLAYISHHSGCFLATCYKVPTQSPNAIVSTLTNDSQKRSSKKNSTRLTADLVFG